MTESYLTNNVVQYQYRDKRKYWVHS